MVSEEEDKTMRFQFTKIEMAWIRFTLIFFFMERKVYSNEKRSNENRYSSRSVNGRNANRRKLTNNPSKISLKHKPGPACPCLPPGRRGAVMTRVIVIGVTWCPPSSAYPPPTHPRPTETAAGPTAHRSPHISSAVQP